MRRPAILKRTTTCTARSRGIHAATADASQTWNRLAPYYDTWVPPDEGDRDFYVDQALRSGGPAVELGPGTGRVTLPIARAGVRVIGVDSSAEMLEICRRRAA